MHWIFKFMANWECRITLAGVADILSKCFITKNVLEKNQTPIAARRARDRLSLELRGYCGTCAQASDLMERFLGRGGAAVVAEVEARGAAPETFVEEVVRLIAVDGHRSIRLRYLRGDKFYDELMPMGELSAEMCKRAFQRLRKFCESCTEQMWSLMRVTISSTVSGHSRKRNSQPKSQYCLLSRSPLFNRRRHTPSFYLAFAEVPGVPRARSC